MMKSSDNAPRILIAADNLHPGGTERQLVELLKGLKRNGRFRVVLAVLDHGGLLQPEAVELSDALLPVRRKARYDVTPVLSLIRSARAFDVRVIHAFGWRSGLAGLIAARVCRLPIVNGSVRDTPPTLSGRDRISRWSARLSNAIVANSRAGLEAYGLGGHARTQVIANGVELRRFENIVPQCSTGPTVCMVANFSRYKDHATAVRAVPAITRAVAGSRLVLVGKNAGRATQAHELVAAMGLSDSISFVSNTTKPESLIAGSEVGILTSVRGESCSNAILEYMALGKPVVATACPGNAELVQDGASGFLVPAASPDAVAKRVIELLQHPDQAREMGEVGRRRVRERHALPRMVAEYEALYDRLLAAK